MNINTLWILILCAFFYTSCNTENQSKITIYDSIRTPTNSITSTDECEFEKKENILNVKINKGFNSPGIRIKGDWDLSDYGTLVIKLENKNGRGSLPLKIRIENSNADLEGWKEGLFVFKINVPEGTSKRYEFTLPPVIPYPELVEKLEGIRYTPYKDVFYTPYLRAPNHFKVYPRSFLNPSKVVAISLYVDQPQNDKEWTLESIWVEKKGKGKLQSWMNLPPDKFFPFIDIYGQFKHKDWPGKTKSDSDLKQSLKNELDEFKRYPEVSNRSKYGGWKRGPMQEATGNFYVKKVGDKWWMVDPEGYLFWSHGAVRVTPSSAVTPLDFITVDGYENKTTILDSDNKGQNGRRFYFEDLPQDESPYAEFYKTHDLLLKPYYEARGVKNTYDFSSSNLRRKYGEDWRKKFAIMVHQRFKSWGMNTIGNSSDKDIYLLDKTPYCDRIEIQSPEIEGCPKRGWWKFKDPFHSDFRNNLRQQLFDHMIEFNDPWCIGFFVDNEIHWGDSTSLAEWILQSPYDQPAKKEMLAYLKTKYESIEKLNSAWNSGYSSWDELLRSQNKPPSDSKEDCIIFSNVVVEKYFVIIHEEFKNVAPNKLYLGCRFSGANGNVLRISSKYCDIMSFNIYRYTLDNFVLPEGIDKPIIIGEFQFGALDRGAICPGMISVENQREYGKAYYKYVESALRHHNIIGTHWFQYADLATTGRFDGANCQTGLTDICDRPYPEMIENVRKVGYAMYEIRSQK